MNLDEYADAFSRAILLSNYEKAREVFEAFASDGRAVSEFVRYGELEFGLESLEEEKSQIFNEGLAEPSGFLVGCHLKHTQSPESPLLPIALVYYETGESPSRKTHDYIHGFTMATSSRDYDKARRYLHSFLADKQAVAEFIRFGGMFALSESREAFDELLKEIDASIE